MYEIYKNAINKKNRLTSLDLCLPVSGITRSIVDAREPILLKVVAPSSHTALSGDVTVFILDSAETESSTISVNIVATNGTNGTKKDEEDKIYPEKNEVNESHEPLVLRYVKESYIYKIISRTNTSWNIS